MSALTSLDTRAGQLPTTTLVIDEFDQWSNADAGFATNCSGCWYSPEIAAE